MEQEKVLFINACARPASRTKALAEAVLSRLPGTVEELRLYDETIAPLDNATLELRQSHVNAGDFSPELFRYAKQFADADTIVIAAPFWDLMFPAVLRSYFEAITVTGLTFRYSPEGIPQGLCKAKRLFYVVTSGGPIGDLNFGFSYTEAMAKGFYGIPEVHCFSAEGLDIFGADVNAIMERAKEEISRYFAGN